MSELIKKFTNPSSEYRGKPFWSWNGKLDKEELLHQIENFKDMGMGGYFCHSRTGLATEYLGEEWFELINASADKGKELGLETWLYDEDRWPSGTAGGMVTENPEYRIKYIRLKIVDGEHFLYPNDCIAAFCAEVDGFSFKNKVQISKGDSTKGKTVLQFTIEEMEKESFYNGNTYVDTMNSEATANFMELTHKQYQAHCGDRLGSSIKGIFTDEPHRGAVMCGFSVSNENPGYLTPYTNTLFEEFKNAYDYDLLSFLPELFLWKDGEKISPVKWQYMELIQRLFINNFMKPLHNWCKDNKMVFTGHLLHEDTLTTQACMIGSIMRAYEYMDYPGVDVLTEFNNSFWIVKQLQSAARQLSKKWLMSELYGCTGWQFDFENHKAVGDWQALFGINLRCHHLSWVSMKGEAKRDYPASISHQSAWYKEYKYIEDYFSRIHVMMNEGEPVCDLLLLNPVESAWSLIYPNWSRALATNDPQVAEIERVYAETFRLLCGAKIDFDYGDEDYLKRLGSVEFRGGVPVIKLGKAVYKSVLITGMLTMRSSTFELLSLFIEKGGNVVFAGEIPLYIDAIKSNKAEKLNAKYIDFNKSEILKNIIAKPFVTIKDQNGNTVDDIYAQVRKTMDGYHLLLMNINRELGFEDLIIETKQDGFCEQWDVRTGEINLIASGDKICFTKSFEPCEEMLLVLTKKNNGYTKTLELNNRMKTISCGDKFAYTLSEPNVCVLDFADYKINDNSWIEKKEILKADSEIRTELQLPLRGGSMLQPWFVGKTEQKELCELTLRFSFDIINMPNNISLAVETPEEFNILINGKAALESTSDYWVDSCFKVFNIARDCLLLGNNVITLECKFRNDINLEAIYLLGDFGVELNGARATLTELPHMLEVGDVTKQGLPFYGAAINYMIDVPRFEQDQKLIFETDDFEAACIKISNDSNSEIIAMKPYKADITKMATAENKINIQYVLTRRNTFGPLHLASLRAGFYGPDTFTCGGDAFLYDGYSLLPQGMIEQVNLIICD